MSTRESIQVPFAKDLSFPIDLVTQRVAVMGTSGGGKSYGAGVLVEGMIGAGAQVVVVDGIGIWYGLRLAKNGKSAGLSIPVFGGEHGDIPLEPTSGALIAKLVADKLLSVVLDVSDMNGAEQRRFVTEFATALHRAKKSARSPVMVVWEECQDFVPQRVSGETAKMVGAMERLIKQGRNYGIGTTLISQRPQAVNKDVLNQCGVVLAFQTIGTHERKAIKDWVVHQGVEQMTQLNELPSLPVGTCFVWSPAWLKIFQRVRVLPKHTADTSKAPEFGDAVVSRELPPVDLETVREQMAATIEKAKADDPKLLRAKVAELEKKLKAAESAKPEPKVERVEVQVLDGNQVIGLRGIVAEFDGVGKKAIEMATEILSRLPRFDAPVHRFEPKAAARSNPVSLSRGSSPSAAPRPVAARVARPKTESADGGSLSGPERKLLIALAQHGRISKVKLALLTNYSHKGGGFLNPLGALRGRGLIEYVEGDVEATRQGIDELGEYEPLPTGAELLEKWLGQLSGPEAKILKCVADAWPNAIPVEELAEQTGYSAKGGGFLNPLGRLRTLELVERGKEVRASDALFDGVRA